MALGWGSQGPPRMASPLIWGCSRPMGVLRVDSALPFPPGGWPLLPPCRCSLYLKIFRYFEGSCPEPIASIVDQLWGASFLGGKLIKQSSLWKLRQDSKRLLHVRNHELQDSSTSHSAWRGSWPQQGLGTSSIPGRCHQWTQVGKLKSSAF